MRLNAQGGPGRAGRGGYRRRVRFRVLRGVAAIMRELAVQRAHAPAESPGANVTERDLAWWRDADREPPP